MIARGSLDALTRAPLRFLGSAWPWRSLIYLLASALPGGLVVGLALLGEQTVGVWGFGALGLLMLLLFTPLITIFEGYRLKLVDSTPLPRPRRASLLTRLRESEIWREFAHALVVTLALWWIDLGVVALSLGIPGMLITAPFQPDGTGPVPSAMLSMAGLLLVPVAAYPITAWAGARAAMTRAILSPGDPVETRLSRARLVDAFEGERRRLERDLHDGAQQRLVALSMKLGLAKLSLPAGSEAAKEVEEAHEQAKLALSELRELIRGIHPQVLSGRGLAAAIRDVAGRSQVPIECFLSLPERLPSAAEVNAYYVVAEALVNVAKHSRATAGWVRAHVEDEVLRLEIGDDGIGGAVVEPRGGLAGLSDRVASLDGRLSVSSPVGGPTVIRAEIPCSA